MRVEISACFFSPGTATISFINLRIRWRMWTCTQAARSWRTVQAESLSFALCCSKFPRFSKASVRPRLGLYNWRELPLGQLKEIVSSRLQTQSPEYLSTTVCFLRLLSCSTLTPHPHWIYGASAYPLGAEVPQSQGVCVQRLLAAPETYYSQIVENYNAIQGTKVLIQPERAQTNRKGRALNLQKGFTSATPEEINGNWASWSFLTDWIRGST